MLDLVFFSQFLAIELIVYNNVFAPLKLSTLWNQI